MKLKKENVDVSKTVVKKVVEKQKLKIKLINSNIVTPKKHLLDRARNGNSELRLNKLNQILNQEESHEQHGRQRIELRRPLPRQQSAHRPENNNYFKRDDIKQHHELA